MIKMFLPFALFTLLLSACCKDSGGLLLLGLLFPDTPSTPYNTCDSTNATPAHSHFGVQGYLGNVRVTDGPKALMVSPEGLFWNDLNMATLLHSIKSPVATKAFDYPDAIYRHGDLALASSATNLAAFNVKTGELAWERHLGDCDIVGGPWGVGDQYFVTRKVREADGVTDHAVFVGDLHNPDHLELLFTPSYSRDTHNWAGYGWITALSAFAGEDGHTYLLTKFFEPKRNSYEEAYFMALYDATTRAWVYERQPITKTGINQLDIIGNSAYIGLGNKVVEWDLAEGNIRDSILLFNQYSTIESPVIVDKLWVNEQYIMAKTNNGDLQVFDRISHAALYRIDRVFDNVQVDFDLNRLFVSSANAVEVYEISTGKELERIISSCEGFTGNIVVWKGSQGTIELAAAGKAGNIYRYVLQP